MKLVGKILCSLALLLLISACATTGLYYLGLHGPSVKETVDVHEGYTLDDECLECHGPGREEEGPLTTHPRFTGCLKCHNDEIISVRTE